MAHINSGVIAISQTPNPTKFQKTLGVNDYYWGAEDFELPLGHIQMLGKSDEDILRAGAPVVRARARARLHGQARDRLLADHRGPAAPGEPRHGRPRRPHPRRQDLPQPRAAQAAARQAEGADGAARLPRHGDPELVDPRPADPARRRRAPVRHRALRRPTPRRSALDVNCKAHDVDNLYVVDTSFFPSSSAVNPALTAMANALRVGDHLLERLGATVEVAAAAEGNAKPVEVHA